MIQFERIDAVGKITLNRPEKYNSFVREMALALQDTLVKCESDDSIRCILITGAGKAFCAGQDLKEAIDPKGPEIEKIVREHYNPIIKKIRSIDKPIIAAVNGVAAGAGANLALACDIVTATQSANFIQAFCKIGLVPDSGGTYFIPRLIGLPKATAIMMTGESVSAEKAEQQMGGESSSGNGSMPPINSGGRKGEGQQQANVYAPPADIPSGNDDDVVARQIREAAVKESDPTLREKLWQEYRKYKNQSQGN